MLVIHNAKIYTQDPSQPQASALLIQGSKVLCAGSEADVLAAAPAGVQKVNLAGRTMWPGLTDAHVHLQYYSLGLQQVETETDTREECLKRVGDRARTTPPGEWILGWGWNQNVWDRYGTAEDLDRVAPNHPVYLSAKSGHASWANTRALQLAGIQRDTPDPEGGKIQRDSLGNPTGILLETAMLLVENVIPANTVVQIKDAVLNAQQVLWKMGLTGVHDYDTVLLFSALQDLEIEDRLRLRVVKGIPHAALPFALGAGLRSGFGSEYVRLGCLKLFADGALGPQTAAMLQPYENSTDSGILLMDAEQVFEIGQQAARGGIALATHAIGDRANHEILNGYEHLRKFEAQNGLPALRHRIEHVQLLHPDDLGRLASLGIIASMQPTHATSDMFIANSHWGKRARFGYAPKTLLERSTALAFGSDAPVETPNPFVSIHAAVTRRRADGTPGDDGWYPEERVSLQEALDAFTTGAAFAAGQEKRLGRLAPGYCADLIVLDQDPFTLPPQELHLVKPRAAMVAGEWVFQS